MADTKNLTVTHVPTEGGKMHTSSTSFENHPSPWIPVLPASFQSLSSVKSETVLESLCKLPLPAPYFPILPCPSFWFVVFLFVHGGHTAQGENDFLVLKSNATF